MAANTATLANFHADGKVKDGDKLFGYEFKDANDASYEKFDVLLRKHPASSKPVVVIVKKTVAGAAVTDTTQYVKSAEFLRDLKPKVGISGVNDDIVESIASQVMTSAELTAAGTPVDSQLPNLATGIEMAFETYTSNTKVGYLRAVAAAVTAVPAAVVAADPGTGIDWMKVALYFGIGTVVTIAGILIFKKKTPKRVSAKKQ